MGTGKEVEAADLARELLLGLVLATGSSSAKGAPAPTLGVRSPLVLRQAAGRRNTDSWPLVGTTVNCRCVAYASRRNLTIHSPKKDSVNVSKITSSSRW